MFNDVLSSVLESLVMVSSFGLCLVGCALANTILGALVGSTSASGGGGG